MWHRAGATGLNAAVESAVITLSWRYLPVVLASSLIMLGWAMIINNLGRRRYPVYWWRPGKVFVSATKQQEARETARETKDVERAVSLEAGGEIFQDMDPDNSPENSDSRQRDGDQLRDDSDDQRQLHGPAP